MLKTMTSFHSVSGAEQAFTEWLKAELAPYSRTVEIDSFGNLIAWRGQSPAIGLFAHMDSVGFIVKAVGRTAVEVMRIGCPQFASWARVMVLSQEGEIPGVLVEKTVGGDRRFFVDVGTEETSQRIRPGDLVSFAPNFVCVDDIVISRGLDNATCCLIAIEVFKQVPRGVFVGTRCLRAEDNTGARAAARRLASELNLALVLDVVCDTDIGEEFHIRIGNGPVVCFGDDFLPSRVAAEQMLAIAERKKIPHQIDVVEKCGTGARCAAANGIPFLNIEVPVRHIHSPNELAHIRDVRNAISLISEYVMESEQWPSSGALTR